MGKTSVYKDSGNHIKVQPADVMCRIRVFIWTRCVYVFGVQNEGCVSHFLKYIASKFATAADRFRFLIREIRFISIFTYEIVISYGQIL